MPQWCGLLWYLIWKWVAKLAAHTRLSIASQGLCHHCCTEEGLFLSCCTYNHLSKQTFCNQGKEWKTSRCSHTLWLSLPSTNERTVCFRISPLFPSVPSLPSSPHIHTLSPSIFYSYLSGYLAPSLSWLTTQSRLNRCSRPCPPWCRSYTWLVAPLRSSSQFTHISV